MELTEKTLSGLSLKFPKPTPKEKKYWGLKKTPLKSHYNPISDKIKKELFEAKGSFCFCGECEHCGGTLQATDTHHFPHKGPHSTPDNLKYLWPVNRLCHDYYHDHPAEERMLFKKLEELGYPVYWKTQGKKIGGV